MGVKVAFIGAGYMAREHIKAYKDIEGVELAGIYNRTRDKAQALADEFGIALVADSIDALYDSTRADLVVVAVYETAVEAVAENTFKHPWAIFLEKPPGYTIPLAEKIAGMAQGHGSPVMVGLNRRYLSSTRAVLDSLAQQAGPRVITVFDQQNLDVAKQFNHHDDVIKHWMYANCIHLIDYISLFGRGAVVSVNVLDRWVAHETPVMRALVSFDSGDTAFYQCLWNGPGPWQVSVATPAIRWEMRPLEKATYQLRGEHKLNDVAPHERDSHFKPGLRLQAEQCIKRLRGEAADMPDMQEAMRTMNLIHRIYGV